MVEKKKFGTFLGVFLPSILTVLGLIMYLRFGWVVGNLGLPLTIVTVLLANIITFITGLSAAAIATNIKVGVGGVYYLISRSLGLETGGAIGIAFYISRTLSITFYAFGLSESILLFWPVELWGPVPGFAIPALTAFIIIIITIASGKSAELVLKIQIPMLILVVLSILALIIGVLMGDLRVPEWTPAYRTVPAEGGFWVIFAVFFPGVTGFLAGIAMSGDLKTPGKSIKNGTLNSVVTGTLVYLLIPILLSITALVPLDKMAQESFGLRSWSEVAFMGGLFIYPAAWGAILSSAIGSVLSGPRVLQSLSMDGLAPKFLSRVSKSGQPTIATWITGCIALAAVALGELNTVAKFVTVLFLTLYVVINVVAAIEKLVAEPSYRPKVDIPWYWSMVGAVGSLYVIYLISPVALVAAFVLEAACYIYFKKKALEQQWGDVTAGLWMKLARFSLLRINKRYISPRNWRPIILLFAKDIDERIELVKLAAAFGQKRGIFSISKLVFGQDEFSRSEKKELKGQMVEKLRSHQLEGFCEVNTVNSLNEGILNISKGHGIAGLKTNTVMFGWSEDRSANLDQLKNIRKLAEISKNIVLAKFNDPLAWKIKKFDRIDIWWSGWKNNGNLMLIFAYMLKLNPEWEEADIHIRSVVNDRQDKNKMADGIQHSLNEARIPAKIDITVNSENKPFRDYLHQKSSDADIVFLGLGRPKPGNEEKQVAKIEQLGDVAKTVVFVQNNSIKESMPLLLDAEG